MNVKLPELLQKSLNLPTVSGCYLMKDHQSRVIYIGKAKNLKQRVSSYFNDSSKSLKTQFLVQHIREFEFFVTSTDVESYVLENNLIKEHTPKYNIRLRDDKTYPYVQVNLKEPFPRLEFIRRPKKEKSKLLFGPFPIGLNIWPTISILTKTFQLRDCTLNEFKRRDHPCLLYQMKQCSAPCVKLINKQDYSNQLELAVKFYQDEKGRIQVIEKLKEMMFQFSQHEEFERAAFYRDQITVLEKFHEEYKKQSVESLSDAKDVDLWSYYEGEEELDISVYMVRKGILIGQKNFYFFHSQLAGEIQEEWMSFILQYYQETQEVRPELIVLDQAEVEEEIIEALKTINQNSDLKVKTPGKKYRSLMMMTQKHAQECQRVRQESGGTLQGLSKLKELLGLKNLPRHLECFDVAVWQGQSPAGSQVVSIDGQLEKNLYRYYHLKERPEGNNDFAMLEELLRRRMTSDKLPDVFVVDGGVAQVNTFTKVLKELKIETPVVGIAKARQLKDQKTEERLIIPGRTNPFSLLKSPALMKIIVELRNEAHRFSRKLHHHQESKRLMKPKRLTSSERE